VYFTKQIEVRGQDFLCTLVATWKEFVFSPMHQRDNQSKHFPSRSLILVHRHYKVTGALGNHNQPQCSKPTAGKMCWTSTETAQGQFHKEKQYGEKRVSKSSLNVITASLVLWTDRVGGKHKLWFSQSIRLLRYGVLVNEMTFKW
jgi:hypothetical protein